MRKKKTHMGKQAKERLVPAGLRNRVFDDIRQLRFPTEFRIAAPSLPLDVPEVNDAKPQSAPGAQTAEQQPTPPDSPGSNQLVAEFATCLWYLKTKHFKREWDNVETKDNDPRVRRALGRLNKSIELLKESGIEVDDPTNKRYPQGGEGMMRPIQFLPTAGLTFEVVTETVAPVIYRDGRLIQRGEVFVAVPKEEATAVAKETVTATPIESGTALSESKAASGEANSVTGGVTVANNDGSKGNGDKPQAALVINMQASDKPTECGSTESIGSTAEADATPLIEPDNDSGKSNCGQRSTDKDY